MRNFQLLLGSLLIVLGSLTAALAQGPPIPCYDFAFSASTVSFNDSGVIQPAATYNLSATYCPPKRRIGRRNFTVQVLLHGGTSNKLYWSALGPVGSTDQFQPNNYSYVDFARDEGYHTIAIDRLGAGSSSRPDPTFVRVGLQAELTYTILQQIRNFGYPPFSPVFQNIILVGHSLGGLITNVLLNKYPEAVDGVVLTGYSHVLSNAQSAITAQQFAPASTVRPSDFGNLDPGYVTFSNETNRREWYFAADGTFDPQAAALAFQRQDVQAVSEQASIIATLTSSFINDTTSYSGPLSILLGHDDQVFCRGDCGTGSTSFAALSQPFFPNVSAFMGFILPNAGQHLQYHYNAQEGFDLVHDWLDSVGF